MHLGGERVWSHRQIIFFCGRRFGTKSQRCFGLISSVEWRSALLTAHNGGRLLFACIPVGESKTQIFVHSMLILGLSSLQFASLLSGCCMFWKRAYEDSMPDHVDRCPHCCTSNGRKDERPAPEPLTCCSALDPLWAPSCPWSNATSFARAVGLEIH